MILRKFMKHVSDQNWFAVGCRHPGPGEAGYDPGSRNQMETIRPV